jgi:ubiquinone/menaquinone biosynthesis C-methylase UbiE
VYERLVERNQATFDRAAESYTELSLMGAERTLVERLGKELAGYEMLDLGVGTGRTGYTFAPLVKRYVAVDYSSRMIERARALLGDHANAELIVADARDLAEIPGSFDLALFSYNGIDAVRHEDRLKILAEVRAKLKPGGLFFFSAHSLDALPLSARRRRGGRPPAGSLAEKLYHFAGDVYFGVQARRSNRRLDLAAARQRGWAIVRDPAHHFSLDVYYIEPSAQRAQLVEAGFEPIAVLAESGAELGPSERYRDAWLNYLSRRPD